LSGFANEVKQLIFGDTNDANTKLLGFSGQKRCRLLAWHKERLGQLILMRFPLFKHAARVQLTWLSTFYSHRFSTENKATCGIHEREKIKIAVLLSTNRLFV